MFVANVGGFDRLLRVVVGLLLIVAPFVTGWTFWANPIAQWGAPIIGIVLVLTGFVGFCPIYRILGIRTNSAR